MKYVVILGDGMADYPLPERDNKTPLALSHTPAMDRLARNGELGLVRTIPEGMDPGSDVANLSVLGYDPKRFYSGRAPIEAASIGVELSPADVAFRCNLVTFREQNGRFIMDDYSAGHIATADARLIIKELKRHLDAPDVTFYPGVSYRHLMVWNNGCADMKTTPPHDITGRPIADYLPQGNGAETIRALMERAREILAELEINRQRACPVGGIWLWGQGRAIKLPRFKDKYGISGSVISAVDLVKGLGICAGLRVINVPGATGYLDTNYEGKVCAALDALAEGDFVYVHVEAPDEASHKGSLDEKIRAIEDFDSRIVAPIVAGLEQRYEEFRLMVLPDHPTPLAIRTHAPDPVPFIMYASRDASRHGARDRAYTEQDAAQSGLFINSGWQLMDRLIQGF
ncbi:MAG: cofactor-independent phosphoglycerate mutase [Desulfobacterota bacterium]|nr:cofactor-independent phosphoglycerate mutase [Thermodesulfobacteriota bacterium]